MEPHIHVLDLWSIGIVILDRRGGIVFMNREAARIVEQRDGLEIRSGALVAARPKESARLSEMIAMAAAGDGTAAPAGDGMIVSRRSSRKALQIVVMRVLDHQTKPKPVTAVLIGDPERGFVYPPHLLVRLYGLTATESKIARLLIRGKTPRDMTVELDISMSTVRTHLQRILHKTETRRQSELLRLLLCLPILAGQDST